MSFASYPSESVLKMTMHVGSESTFKRDMKNLQIGQTVSLFKIKGRIALPEYSSGIRSIVFIAGGVGMTPFRSMIMHAKEIGMSASITLLQVQRGDSFLFASDLRDKVDTYLPVQPDDFRDKLNKIIDQNPEALFYICGSQRLIDGAMLCFALKGTVPEDRILTESFS